MGFFGAIGQLLPAIGGLFGGGGGFGIGFSLLSGLIGQLFQPKMPDMSDYVNNATQNFDATTFGSFNGYSGYGANGGNAGSAGNVGDGPIYPTFSQHMQASNMYNQIAQHYGVDASNARMPSLNDLYDARHQVSNLDVQGQINDFRSAYEQQFGGMSNQYGGPQQTDPYQGAYQMGAQFPGMPGALAPAQGFFGSYAAQGMGAGQSLFGHQAGGPRVGPNIIVLYNNNQSANQTNNVNNYGAQPQPQPPAPPEPVDYGTDPQVDTRTPVAATPPPARQPAQTRWQTVEHVDNAAEWQVAAEQVKERLFGGDESAQMRYHFGGQDPRNNNDGFNMERMATWHVMQQNDSLRLDVMSGRFFETRADGSRVDRFTLGEVASLERSAGGNWGTGSALIRGFMESRMGPQGIAGHVNRVVPTPAPSPNPATFPNPPSAAPHQQNNTPFAFPGSGPTFNPFG